jgi:hypothetical protein
MDSSGFLASSSVDTITRFFFGFDLAKRCLLAHTDAGVRTYR